MTGPRSRAVLLALLAAVVTLGVIAGTALVGGDEPAAGSSTRASRPATAPPLAYEQLRDDTGRLTVDAPRTWADVDGGPWRRGGAVVGERIAAAPSLAAFEASVDGPGLSVQSSAALARQADPAGLLAAAADGLDDVCDLAGPVEDYDDPAYAGVQRRWRSCGEDGGTVLLLAAEPPGADRILLLRVQAPAPAADDVIAHALATFFVLPDPPAT